MEVLAAVAPAADVDAADVAERADLSLDPAQEHAQLRGELVRQVAWLSVVLARLEEDDERQAGRLVESPEPPVIVGPEVTLVGGGTTAAVDPTLAEARPLHLLRRPEHTRPHLAVEGERLPLLDRRHAQRAGHPGVELFRRLGHRSGRC